MKLCGSRSRNEHDKFSDYDYTIESEQDFEEIHKQMENGLCWKTHQLPNLNGIIVINQSGDLLDYNCDSNQFLDCWTSIYEQEDHPNVREYWLFTYKHLKALYRGYHVLLGIGVEASTALARDIYLEYKLAKPAYKNFYNYKSIKDSVEPHAEELNSVLRLPYRTADEVAAKIKALNALVYEVSGAFDARLCETFDDLLASAND